MQRFILRRRGGGRNSPSLINDLELEIVDTEVEFIQSNIDEEITDLIEIKSALSKDIQKN